MFSYQKPVPLHESRSYPLSFFQGYFLYTYSRFPLFFNTRPSLWIISISMHDVTFPLDKSNPLLTLLSSPATVSFPLPQHYFLASSISSSSIRSSTHSIQVSITIMLENMCSKSPITPIFKTNRYILSSSTLVPLIINDSFIHSLLPLFSWVPQV